MVASGDIRLCHPGCLPARIASRSPSERNRPRRAVLFSVARVSRLSSLDSLRARSEEPFLWASCLCLSRAATCSVSPRLPWPAAQLVPGPFPLGKIPDVRQDGLRVG